MPQPRKPSWHRAIESMRSAVGQLDSPQYRAEALRDDLNPRNFLQLDQEMARRDQQHPRQQQALGEERKRLEDIQAQYVQQQAQQFPQRLAQGLELQQHTGLPSPGPEQFMAKLMLQMQRRHGMPRPQIGGEGGSLAQGDY